MKARQKRLLLEWAKSVYLHALNPDPVQGGTSELVGAEPQAGPTVGGTSEDRSKALDALLDSAAREFGWNAADRKEAAAMLGIRNKIEKEQASDDSAALFQRLSKARNAKPGTPHVGSAVAIRVRQAAEKRRVNRRNKGGRKDRGRGDMLPHMCSVTVTAIEAVGELGPRGDVLFREANANIGAVVVF